ncbi:hypothetical protein ACLB2K_053370 [Fragaria x ananassa]
MSFGGRGGGRPELGRRILELGRAGRRRRELRRAGRRSRETTAGRTREACLEYRETRGNEKTRGVRQGNWGDQGSPPGELGRSGEYARETGEIRGVRQGNWGSEESARETGEIRGVSQGNWGNQGSPPGELGSSPGKMGRPGESARETGEIMARHPPSREPCNLR